MTEVIREHIEIVSAPGGPKARISGHRIRVSDIAVWHEKLGMSPDEIIHQYPALTPADIHAALAYYWDNRDEIESQIEEDETFAEALRLSVPSPLQEKLDSHLSG